MITQVIPMSVRWWEEAQQGCLGQGPRQILELVRDHGDETLSFFGLAPENAHYLAPSGNGVVNYRLSGDVAVLPGDPVCQPGACEEVLSHFLDFCQREHWHLAIFQAHPTYLPFYHKLGLHAFKIGEEAILHPQTFMLSGTAKATLRKSCHRAERAGVTLRWYDGAPPQTIMEQLRILSQAWLEEKSGKGAIEMGFSLGRLNELEAFAARADAIASTAPTPDEQIPRTLPRLVTGVAFDGAGQACAFISCTPIYGSVDIQVMGSSMLQSRCGWGWAVDLMRHRPEAPYGALKLLIEHALERFHGAGAEVLSLGVIALANSHQEMEPLQRALARGVAQHLQVLKSYQTLLRFKQDFQPSWESRYLVISERLSIPKVLWAVWQVHQSK